MLTTIHLQCFAAEGDAADAPAPQTDTAPRQEAQAEPVPAPAAEPEPREQAETPAEEPEATRDAAPNPARDAAPEAEDTLPDAMRETLLARLRGARARQIARRWQAEAAEIRKVYPDFDLRTALTSNQDFAALVRAGIPLKRAYEAANLDEILGSALRYAAIRGGQRTADAMREPQRPQENSVLDRASSLRTTDVNSLTQKDILRIIGEVNRGAKITFR